MHGHQNVNNIAFIVRTVMDTQCSKLREILKQRLLAWEE